MQQTVYIETSIPSFYYEDRTDAPAIARREWTRQWWDNQRHHFELFSSHAVLDELKKGEYAKKADCLSLLDDIPFLRIEAEVSEITATYVEHKVMPNDPTGDALPESHRILSQM